MVEGRLAAKLVAKQQGVTDWQRVTTLQDLQRLLDRPLPAMAALMRDALKAAPYSKAELAEAFGQPVTQV